jgi:hypothetical protein
MLPTLGLLGSAVGGAQTGESEKPLLSHSATYSFDQLPLKHSPSGAVTRPVLHGKLPTGEVVAMHETTLMPGQMPHPAHKHVHTEFMLIREGTVEFTMNVQTRAAWAGRSCVCCLRRNAWLEERWNRTRELLCHSNRDRTRSHVK